MVMVDDFKWAYASSVSLYNLMRSGRGVPWGRGGIVAVTSSRNLVASIDLIFLNEIVLVGSGGLGREMQNMTA